MQKVATHLEKVDDETPVHVVDASLAVDAATEQEGVELRSGDGGDFSRVATVDSLRLLHRQRKRQVNLGSKHACI